MSSIRAALALTVLTAAGLASMPALGAELTPGQRDAAAHVYTGVAQCEQGQQVALTPMAGQEGHFRLEYKKVSYDVVPEVTTTGAVRLEDKKAGVIWIQIPAKSMLLNSKVGHRMVDDCLQSEQRADRVAATR